MVMELVEQHLPGAIEESAFISKTAEALAAHGVFLFLLLYLLRARYPRIAAPALLIC